MGAGHDTIALVGKTWSGVGLLCEAGLRELLIGDAGAHQSFHSKGSRIYMWRRFCCELSRQLSRRRPKREAVSAKARRECQARDGGNWADHGHRVWRDIDHSSPGLSHANPAEAWKRGVQTGKAVAEDMRIGLRIPLTGRLEGARRVLRAGTYVAQSVNKTPPST